MEGLPHWPAILRAYAAPGSRVQCVKIANASVAAAAATPAAAAAGGAPVPTQSSGYKCRGIYLGNTIFAPVLGSVRLHVLRQLHDIRRCLHLMAGHEARVSMLYDRVVHTRLECAHRRPRPPGRVHKPPAPHSTRARSAHSLRPRASRRADPAAS